MSFKKIIEARRGKSKTTMSEHIQARRSGDKGSMQEYIEGRRSGKEPWGNYLERRRKQPEDSGNEVTSDSAGNQAASKPEVKMQPQKDVRKMLRKASQDDAKKTSPDERYERHKRNQNIAQETALRQQRQHEMQEMQRELLHKQKPRTFTR